MLYLFSCGVQVFSSFGPVLKIAMFDKNGGVQALIQYPGEMEIFHFFRGVFSIEKSLVACYWFESIASKEANDGSQLY